MVEIQLHSDCPCSDTLIPNRFIDIFMPEADGDSVKVYLYLLRCVQSHAYHCTIPAIAEHINRSEADVVQALNYWQKQGLLALELNSGKNISIRMLNIEQTGAIPVLRQESDTAALQLTAISLPPADNAPAADAPAPAPRRASAKPSYTPDEITGFLKNPDISELFFVVETYIKHPLSANDMNTVLFWHEDLHFSSELIVYLLEYCISKGHTSMRYLDKVAQGWHTEGITTVEQAKEEAAIHSQAYYGVMKAFGITGRSLVKAETAYISKWTKEYGFDLAMIQEACSRTIAAIHQPSFEYADSILTRWYKEQVHTPADIEARDAAYQKTRKVTVKALDAPQRKNAFNNFAQRTYDFDKLEELLLTTSVRG